MHGIMWCSALWCRRCRICRYVAAPEKYNKDDMSYAYIVDSLWPQSTYIYRAPQCMSPRWNRDSPTPLAASECALPPPGPKGGGAHSPAAKGLGESQFQRLEKRLALCLLCVCGYKEKMKRIMYSGPSFYLIQFKYFHTMAIFPFCVYIYSTHFNQILCTVSIQAQSYHSVDFSIIFVCTF